MNKLNLTPIENEGKSLCWLILAYWTPERIELWREYEKTDRSIPWREYEHAYRKEESA